MKILCIANALNVEENDVLRAVKEYTDALILIDKHDHRALVKPLENKPIYRMTYIKSVLQEYFGEKRYV